MGRKKYPKREAGDFSANPDDRGRVLGPSSPVPWNKKPTGYFRGVRGVNLIKRTTPKGDVYWIEKWKLFKGRYVRDSIYYLPDLLRLQACIAVILGDTENPYLAKPPPVVPDDSYPMPAWVRDSFPHQILRVQLTDKSDDVEQHLSRDEFPAGSFAKRRHKQKENEKIDVPD